MQKARVVPTTRDTVETHMMAYSPPQKEPKMKLLWVCVLVR